MRAMSSDSYGYQNRANRLETDSNLRYQPVVNEGCCVSDQSGSCSICSKAKHDVCDLRIIGSGSIAAKLAAVWPLFGIR